MRARLVLPLVAAGLLGCEPPPDSLAADGSTSPRDAGALPDAGAQGRLRIVALDDETNLPLPSRAIITAVPPTPPVRFDPARGYGGCARNEDCWPDPMKNNGNICERERCWQNGNAGAHLGPGVLGAPEGVLLPDGDGAFPIPPGSYDVFVTHGPEWEAHEERVTVGAGAIATVQAPLRHSVDTRGWLAADLHVHTGRSFDSKLPVQDRVVSEVAVGVELIVSTDHNVITDLQPDVEAWGYADVARAIVGDEYNFYEGHGGVYPMPYDPKLAYGGTVENKLDWDSVRLVHSADIFKFLRTFKTNPAVTVNHPRLPPDLGYFINMKQYGASGWAPPTPLDDAGLFDAIEMLSGYQGAPDDLSALLRDWFFLLNSGVRVTGLGSSDTHRLNVIRAGFPRSWLRVPTESPAALADAAFADAVKGQRAIASNGPWALLTVDGAPIGDLVTNVSGTATVEMTVDAPGWIDVDTVRLYVNGKVAQTFPVKPGARPRFHQVVQLKLPSGDAWVALQAGGKRPLPTALIGEYGGGRVVPFAITNPVFIDGDGDKAWQPRILERDVGPVGPIDRPPPTMIETHGPAPEECEPSLWVDPSQWVNP